MKFFSLFCFRGSQLFCGIHIKSLPGSDRSSISWEFWKIWTSRWQEGRLFFFFPPSITQEETLLLCFLCVEVGKLIYLNMYHWINVIFCLSQGIEMSVALPLFLLNIDGASGGILLLGIVGVCILLPLVMAVIYLSRSSKYTGNYVRHQTMSAYYYFMKPSLAPRYWISPGWYFGALICQSSTPTK